MAQNNPEDKHWFTFGYTVVDRNDKEGIQHIGSVDVALSDREIDLLAQALQEHGGLDISVQDILWLDKRVYHTAITDFQCSREGGDLEYEDIWFESDSELPEELMKMVRQRVHLSMVCNFYYTDLDGKEQMSPCAVSIEPDVFDAMVETVGKGHTTGTDFDNLKKDNPEAWNRSGAWVIQWASNWLMATYNRDAKEFDIRLKEFPYQVYEAVTL